MSLQPGIFSAGTGPDWKAELADAIVTAAELADALELDAASRLQILPNPAFRLCVPRTYVRKMNKRDIGDPLLRQVLPLTVERDAAGQVDPVSDLNAMVAPGLLHKYHGRVLLVTTGACAVHCRYCFRRHFPYTDANPLGPSRSRALAYIVNNPDIREVILSGGDPLVLDNAKLGELVQQLAAIPHLHWLRIHTRLPVVLPGRVDDGLLTLLQSRLKITVVIHANHPREIQQYERDALQRLAAAGASLLNQSVLLRGVNDCADTLGRLSERLYDSGVLPYYLHMLDPVQGAMHFDVPDSEAIRIIETMRASLPGFLVPRLVRERAGESSKTAISGI